MTDKLTAAEIERLRPANPRTGMGRHVHEDTLAKLCDMASASLPSAGDGEVEELIGRLDKFASRHPFYSEARAEIIESRRQWKNYEALARDLGKKLDRAEAEIASLRERVEQMEGGAKKIASLCMKERLYRRAAEARVAELTRVVEAKDKVFSKIIKYPRSYKGRTVSWGIEYAFDALKSIAKTGLSVAPSEALTAGQGEERRRFEFKEAPPGLVMGPCGEEPAPNSTQGPEKCDSGEVSTPTAAIREAMGALEDCANDLAALVEAQYRGTLGYPAMKRKYKRDMAPVESARAAHAKLAEIIGE